MTYFKISRADSEVSVASIYDLERAAVLLGITIKAVKDRLRSGETVRTIGYLYTADPGEALGHASFA